jgi:hypothetical protein
MEQEKGKQLRFQQNEKNVFKIYIYCPNFFLVKERSRFPLSSMSALGTPLQFLIQELHGQHLPPTGQAWSLELSYLVKHSFLGRLLVSIHYQFLQSG